MKIWFLKKFNSSSMKLENLAGVRYAIVTRVTKIDLALK